MLLGHGRVRRGPTMRCLLLALRTNLVAEGIRQTVVAAEPSLAELQFAAVAAYSQRVSAATDDAHLYWHGYATDESRTTSRSRSAPLLTPLARLRPGAVALGGAFLLA